MDKGCEVLVEVPAQINGAALHRPGEKVPVEELRQRACTELLRQAAQRDGFLAADDPAGPDGVISEAASQAIEVWLEREIQLPELSEEALRRHFEAHKARFAIGERVCLRHILFAVTAGVDVATMRERAEQALLDVRCHDGTNGGSFAARARELSNCPSGAQGGDLGMLTADDVAPELARELFGRAEVGVLPRLVHSRFGLHVVEVLERIPGIQPGFESVRAAVANSMQRATYVTALRHLLLRLANQSDVYGVDLDDTAIPLVQ
ncbi:MULTISPECIES: peptidylprolyl isomerase [Thauera]|uniref:peptidylprolyl isomerase n=1 Tax=Thauera aromatica K172 TaxID=44139 RepID=A0A2R4BM91_THAAR|nr:MULTISPECIES: peptidylprolyl isomerase [Thauera]AVR88362.1 Peptidyl-prolyl cis-trans isomerase PpiD [Thauera aromatica K172]KIN91774.1 PPIC-type PPIASE domain protein [Thauera sp. SWB20]